MWENLHCRSTAIIKQSDSIRSVILSSTKIKTWYKFLNTTERYCWTWQMDQMLLCGIVLLSATSIQPTANQITAHLERPIKYTFALISQSNSHSKSKSCPWTTNEISGDFFSEYTIVSWTRNLGECMTVQKMTRQWILAYILLWVQNQTNYLLYVLQPVTQNIQVVLRHDSNESHLVPEIRFLKRCRYKRFAVWHRLSNQISGIRCDLLKSHLKTWLECFEWPALTRLWYW